MALLLVPGYMPKESINFHQRCNYSKAYFEYY